MRKAHSDRTDFQPPNLGAERAKNPRHVVVAGGGPAAHRFADAMHSRGLDGWHVTVLTEEAHLPYDRVALSKALTDSTVDLTLGSASMWDHESLSLRTGERVTAVDTAGKSVTTAAGTVYPYDELVVATGSDAARLPIAGSELTHVYRTLEDVRAINTAIADLTAKFGRKVNAVTIGGGLLGLESAAGTEQLGATPIVINGSPWLMNTQLDEGAGQALGRLIEAKGFTVHGGVFPSEVLSDDDGQVTGVLMADGRIVDADIVIVAIGVRPRDELFRAANGPEVEGIAPQFQLGPRGGVVISDDCSTEVPGIWAIGEVANFGGMCLGLVAPANTMAEIVADRLHGGVATFPGFDTATKLKLSGVDVASFGDAFARTEHALEIVYADPARGVYQKIVTTDDAKTLLGGIFVGDASPYTSLRPMLGRELAAEPGAYLTAAGGGDAPDTELPDDAILCSCNNVSAGTIRDTVNGCGACDGNAPVQELGELKGCTRAGTSCGSCVPMLKKLLETELTKSGVAVSKALCEHIELSRQELFETIRVLELDSFEEVMAKYGTGDGCDICKPTIANILASQNSAYVLDAGRGTLQDTNDRALANMQKDGTYSVVPRIAGGEITPKKLGVIAAVAEKYNLYTKITGGQRIDMFGARLEELPEIWKELVDAGFESGQAYGKSLRTVKSCVGSTWCRFGVQDSVAMAIAAGTALPRPPQPAQAQNGRLRLRPRMRRGPRQGRRRHRHRGRLEPVRRRQRRRHPGARPAAGQGPRRRNTDQVHRPLLHVLHPHRRPPAAHRAVAGGARRRHQTRRGRGGARHPGHRRGPRGRHGQARGHLRGRVGRHPEGSRAPAPVPLLRQCPRPEGRLHHLRPGRARPDAPGHRGREGPGRSATSDGRGVHPHAAPR